MISTLVWFAGYAAVGVGLLSRRVRLELARRTGRCVLPVLVWAKARRRA